MLRDAILWVESSSGVGMKGRSHVASSFAETLRCGRAMWSHRMFYVVLLQLSTLIDTQLISLKWKSTTTTATISATLSQPKAATFVCKWCHCLSLTLRAIFLITNLLILKICLGVYVLIFTFDDPANILKSKSQACWKITCKISCNDLSRTNPWKSRPTNNEKQTKRWIAGAASESGQLQLELGMHSNAIQANWGD